MTCHRLATIACPATEAERAYNDRADRFVQLLHRLRDLEWTAEDYFWLCKRKGSQLALMERKKFADAPVLMDFRRATQDNPDENCEAYNRGFLRAMARRVGVPVVQFCARYEGLPPAEGACGVCRWGVERLCIDFGTLELCGKKVERRSGK